MKFTTTDEDLPFVAVYEHHDENRVQAAFRWKQDCFEFCKRRARTSTTSASTRR